jgi:hypothetical protein
MPANVGIVNYPNLGTNEVIFPVYEYTREVFFSDAPLFLGLPREVTNAHRFNMGTARVRPRTLTLTAAIADNTNTTVTLSDASVLQIGDVLQLNSGERVEVTADPSITNTTTGAGTVTARRGAEATTAAAQTNNTTVVVIANSRTGGEIDQSGTRNIPPYVQQNIQTFQYPVQVGGLANSIRGAVTASGGNLMSENMGIRLQEFVRDVEHAMLYQIGEFGATGNRAKMKGIRQILSEAVAGNLTTSPTNSGAYAPTDLHRDTFQKIMDVGGRPDTLLVSPSFSACFVRWGWARAFMTPEMTSAGQNTQQVYVPLLGRPITVILEPQLRGFTAVALTARGPAAGRGGVKVRYVREESWNQRGNRGDAVEGEWLGDFAIDVADPTHHAWVEGVTVFTTP